MLAPRGIVAAAVTSVFAIEVIELSKIGSVSEKLAAQAELMPTVVFVVIVVTVSFYGLAAAPLARRLGLSNASREGVLFAGSDPWVRPIAVALYEEGMKLAKRCQEMLQQAELKITKLQEEFGALREEPEPYPLGEEEEIPPE